MQVAGNNVEEARKLEFGHIQNRQLSSPKCLEFIQLLDYVGAFVFQKHSF